MMKPNLPDYLQIAACLIRVYTPLVPTSFDNLIVDFLPEIILYIAVGGLQKIKKNY